MMTFEEFVRRTERETEKRYCECKVCIEYLHGRKVNVSVRKKNEDIAPSVNLQDFYNYYSVLGDYEEILERIFAVIDNAQPLDESRVKEFQIYEKTKDKIRLLLLKGNYDVKNLVAREFLDMLVLPYIDTSDLFEFSSNEGNAKIMITKHLLELWNVEEEEIFAVAEKNENAENLMILEPMSSIISSLIGGDTFVEDADILPMYVVTNDRKFYGAKYLYFSEKLQEIRDALQSDFYIIPSSVHELIVIPKRSMILRSEELEEMIREVNNTMLEPNEILSYNPFIFTEDKKLALLKG